jgi:hypothetical protein
MVQYARKYATHPGQIENIVLSQVVLTPKGTVAAYCKLCGTEHRVWYAADHYRKEHPEVLKDPEETT